MEKKALNENDNKLLSFCREERTTRQVAEYLGIAVKNVSVRLEKLDRLGLIELKKGGKGKVTTIRTKGTDHKLFYTLKLLEEIKKRGGVTDKEYSQILDYDYPHDALDVTTLLPLYEPKLIENKVFITEEGLKYLKKHSKEVKESNNKPH